MSLQKMDPKLLSDYKKSLKECSESDSGEPVTLSELPAYRFDDISAFEAEAVSALCVLSGDAALDGTEAGKAVGIFS